MAKQSLAGQLIRAEERLTTKRVLPVMSSEYRRSRKHRPENRRENSARFIELAQAKLENQQQEATHELDLRKLEVANLVKLKTRWPNSPP